jgi:exodeoxyribonuclease VII large subunit
MVVVGGSIGHRIGAAIDRGDEQIARQAVRLRTGCERVAVRAQARLDLACDALGRAPRRLDAEARHLDGLEVQVRLVDPVRTMARGWSITRAADGRAVTDASSLTVGQDLITSFAAGSARSRVDEIHPPPVTVPATVPALQPPTEETAS